MQEAFDGMGLGRWVYRLANDTDYASIPKRDPYHPVTGGSPPATKTPIDPNFRSPFIGYDRDDLGRWLRMKPKNAALDSSHFAVLDKQVASHKIVNCRIGDYNKHGRKTSSILFDASYAGLFLDGLDAYDWDNILDSKGDYQFQL